MKIPVMDTFKQQKVEDFYNVGKQKGNGQFAL